MKKSEQTRSSTGMSSDNYTRITDSMKKKFYVRETFFALYHLTRIGLAITIITLIAQTDLKSTKQKPAYNRTQEILQLWSKYMIVDVITVSTYNCPRNYEAYTSAQWQGTKEGCLCQTTLNEYDFIHVLPGQCSLKLIGAGCTRIDPQQSIPFVFWKTESLVCVKRIQGLNFYSNVSDILNASNIKQCSKGQPYEIQSLKADNCPVTAISNISQVYTNKLPQISFSFARETSYPIIDIRMSEYSFCMQYNRQNISPNRFQNYDLQELGISNCQDGDPRVREIDQITQETLFNNNKRILDVVTNFLPVYPRPSDKYVYKLGTVEYPPWTFTCRKSPAFNLTITKNNLQFNDSIQKSQVCVALTSLMISIWGFVYSIICIIRRIVQILYKKNHGILWYPDQVVLRIDPNLHNKPNLACESLTFFLLVLLSLGMLIQLGVQYNYTNSMEKWMRDIYKCMDNSLYFQEWVYNAYVISLQNCIRVYLICILAGGVGVCLDIVFTIWRFHKGDLKAESFQDLFRNHDGVEDKNSDEKIEVVQQISHDNDNDIVIDDMLDNEEGLQENGSEGNVFANRQKTGDIDLFFEKSQEPVSPKRRTKMSSGWRKSKNRTKQLNNLNQTQQSLGNEMEENISALEFDDEAIQKAKKIPRQKKKIDIKPYQFDD